MITGPRASGKTTMATRRAATIVQLGAEAQAATFAADPDAALRGLPEPVLLDEWQKAPGPGRAPAEPSAAAGPTEGADTPSPAGAAVAGTRSR